jgi:hypothetical protein
MPFFTKSLATLVWLESLNDDGATLWPPIWAGQRYGMKPRRL